MKRLIQLIIAGMLIISCSNNRDTLADENKKVIYAKGDSLFTKPVMTLTLVAGSYEISYIDSLNKYYSLAIAFPNNKDYCIQFFHFLPKTFDDYYQTYVYEEKDSLGHEHIPLIDSAYFHINLYFRSLNCVDDISYMNKLISLGVGGFWKADEINYLQSIMRTKIDQNAKAFLTVLSGKPDKDIIGLFKFLYDGPHPPRQMPNTLKNALAGDARLKRLSSEARGLFE